MTGWHKGFNIVTVRRVMGAAVLLVGMFVVAACAGPATPVATPQATSATTSGPTPVTPTSRPDTPAPTPAPTATPEPPTPEPTSEPTSEPTPGATPEPTVDVTALLTSYVGADQQASCKAYHQVYDTELGSIECGPEDLPFDLTLFSSAEDMNAAFDDDVLLADNPPVPDGSCQEANYLDEYFPEPNVAAGRVNCRSHISTSTGSPYNVIEWTNNDLLVIGYISNRADLHTWDELMQFWRSEAGPFPPT